MLLKHSYDGCQADKFLFSHAKQQTATKYIITMRTDKLSVKIALIQWNTKQVYTMKHKTRLSTGIISS